MSLATLSLITDFAATSSADAYRSARTAVTDPTSSPEMIRHLFEHAERSQDHLNAARAVAAQAPTQSAEQQSAQRAAISALAAAASAHAAAATIHRIRASTVTPGRDKADPNLLVVAGSHHVDAKALVTAARSLRVPQAAATSALSHIRRVAARAAAFSARTNLQTKNGATQVFRNGKKP